MAFITRKITRTSQPQELVGIDWSNPLTAGLVSGTNHSRPEIDLATGLNGSNTRSLGVGPIGRNTTTTGLIIHQHNPLQVEITGNRDRTAFFVLSTTTTGNTVISEKGTNTSVVCQTLFSKFSWRGAGSSGDSISTTSDITSGLPVAVAGTYRQTVFTQSVFFSGIKEKTNTGTIDNYTGTAPLVVGARFGNLYGFPGQIYISLFFNRVLSDVEIKSLSDNPWQIFEPIEETIWIPDGVSVTLPTLVQPASTTSAGAWTATGAATLHEAIDEATYSDADYISVAAASTCELVLAESAFPTGNVSLAYRALSSTGNTLTVTLKQGATTIMTRTHALTGTATLYTQALTAGEVAAIVAGPITCTLTSS